jgi:broad specificity phosphatase PhoE/predicted kinase
VSRERASTGLTTRKLLIVMVGLPARGKSYIARKLARYLAWLGHRTRVYNVGSYRRAAFGNQPATFFDPSNSDGAAARQQAAEEALTDACEFLAGSGNVAIYDATNTTRARRARIAERCGREELRVIFIESICDDPALIDHNVRETKLGSPDYVDRDVDEAVADFRARIAMYERAYEQIDQHGDEDAYSFIKLVNLGRDVRLHRIDGYLPGRLVSFLLNTHIHRRLIWLTRHGQSAANVRDRIGGDGPLTLRGEAYARSLAQFVEQRARMECDGAPVTVWTSTLKRATDTARHLPWPKVAWRALDEIDAGICDGLTYEDVKRTMPDEYAARARDKFHYRYPRGESYEDVIERLEPVIIELERQRHPLLIVSHNAVTRILYGYLMDRIPEVCPWLEVPLHSVIELAPNVTGSDERRWKLGPSVEDPNTGG